jgi:type II secretory pathway pseudopilin PulG
VNRLIRDESGFTLVELLVTCVLMLVVLGATLTALESFQSNAETNVRQNDSQDEARRATDLLARDLRNLASPTDEEPLAIKRAKAQDLIVQSVAEVRPARSLNQRNTQYVRYCYDAGEREVVRQRMTWTTATDPPFPGATACSAAGGGGWPITDAAAQDVVNGGRPLFTYNDDDPFLITEIHTSLYVDVNPGRRPRETSLFTTVFLRNQNRRPVARFSAVRDGTSIVLNGSDSEDPEERALYYEWYDADLLDGDGKPTLIGQGIVNVYTPATPGDHTVYLVVKDQADLSSEAPTQTVCVPGGTVTC